MWRDFLIEWTITSFKERVLAWSSKFTPRDANPKYQIMSVIALTKEALIYPGSWTLKLPLPALQLMKGPLRGRNLSLLLGQKISPTLASSIARTGFPPPNCSIQICRRSVAASFISTIRNAPSPIRLANSSILEGGRRFFPKIRKKSCRKESLAWRRHIHEA